MSRNLQLATSAQCKQDQRNLVRLILRSVFKKKCFGQLHWSYYLLPDYDFHRIPYSTKKTFVSITAHCHWPLGGRSSLDFQTKSAHPSHTSHKVFNRILIQLLLFFITRIKILKFWNVWLIT